MAIVGARAYVGVWGGAPAGSRDSHPGSVMQSPPEAESSVAFEARAEEPNLTLLRIVFAKSVMFGGGLNSPLGGLSPSSPPPLFSSLTSQFVDTDRIYKISR